VEEEEAGWTGASGEWGATTAETTGTATTVAAAAAAVMSTGATTQEDDEVAAAASIPHAAPAVGGCSRVLFPELREEE
jgi:hypothetical protein